MKNNLYDIQSGKTKLTVTGTSMTLENGMKIIRLKDEIVAVAPPRAIVVIRTKPE